MSCIGSSPGRACSVRWGLALAALLVAAGCAHRPPPLTKIVGGRQISTRSVNASAYEHISRALLLEEDERWEEAANELQRALIYDGDAPEVHAHLAEVFVRLGRLADAAASVRASLRIETTADGLIAQAHLEQAEGRLAGAVTTLEKATQVVSFGEDAALAEGVYLELAEGALVALDAERARRALADLCAGLPSSIAGHMQLAAVAWALGDVNEARRRLEQVLHEEPNQIDARIQLAWLEAGAGRNDRARVMFLESLDRSEGAYEVAAAYARFLVGTGDAREAALLVEESPVPDTKDADTVGRWIEANRAARRFEGAIAFLRKLKAGDASSETIERVPLYVARLLETSRDRAGAIKALAEIPGTSPLHLEATLAAAQMLRDEGKAAEAAKLLEPLSVNDQRADEEVTAARALTDEKAGDPARGIRRLEEGLVRRPASLRLLLAMASMEERRGQWRRALELIGPQLAKQAVGDELFGFVEIANFWGFVAADHGHDLAGAHRRLVVALALQPATGAIIDSVGWSHFKMGDLARAAAFLEQAARLEPDDPEVTAHLGELYARRAETERAVAAFEKALTLHPEEALRRRLEEKLSKLGAQKAARP